MTPQDLCKIADEILEVSTRNDATMDITRNALGNLAIFADEIYVGWVDMKEAKVHWS